MNIYIEEKPRIFEVFFYIKLMFRYLILVFLFSFFNLNSQTLSTQDSILITSIMDKQKQAWNNFDIAEFMKGYLNFDNLVFLVKMDLYMDGIILKKDI